MPVRAAPMFHRACRGLIRNAPENGLNGRRYDASPRKASGFGRELLHATPEKRPRPDRTSPPVAGGPRPAEAVHPSRPFATVMFSNLPILGDEAKLAFRSKPSGIARMAASVIREDDPYWDQFTTLFDTASDVYSLIRPDDIRRALRDFPDNVSTLIRVLCKRLFELVASPAFPASSSASVAALASAFIKSRGVERNTNKEVLNCLRVLQRVLPVVFEAESGPSRFEMAVFWLRGSDEVLDRTAELPDTTSQFVIDDDDEDDVEVQNHTSEGTASSRSTMLQHPPSLAERLFGCVFDLMFCR
jgi:hypothetical protein